MIDPLRCDFVLYVSLRATNSFVAMEARKMLVEESITETIIRTQPYVEIEEKHLDYKIRSKKILLTI